MAVEYLGLSSLNGPLAVLEGVSGASYDEIVEMTVDGKEKKLGRIIEAYEDKAVIQVFESTGNMALKNTHTRLTGHPMEIGVSADMLGRTFDGLGNPIDGLGPILADKKLDVNGKPLNPVAREYPRNYIRTGISAIDGLMTLIRGQKLPIFSGFSVRVVLNIINFAICYFFTIRYMKTIKADPKKSLNYEAGMSASDSMGAGKDGAKAIEAHLTTKHLISLIGLVVAVAAILVGSVKYKWSYDQIAATFFTLAVVVGLLNGMGINGTTKVFIGGCSKMVNAAFIVGFANGISVILASGNILNTIVYWLSIPMSGMGSILGANFMFVANLIINLFIPSGSGQAVAVMPLMVPVADLAGITRQVAVQAFQFGDGFSNCLFPTAGTLMGSLAIAKTDWTKYAKWLMPLLGCQVILSFVSLTVLQSIGWTGL